MGIRFLLDEHLRGQLWHALAWQWPVLRGDKVEHERIVLLANTQTRPRMTADARSSWLTQHMVQYLNAHERNRDPNVALSRSLAALAAEMVSTRIDREART